MNHKKGDLYLFDDNYRFTSAGANMRVPAAMVMATNRRVMAAWMATEIVTANAPSSFGDKQIWISNWKPFDNGLAVLVEIIGRQEEKIGGDIYKMLFNNKNGVRYVYKYQLKHAKLITKHNNNT